jgi:hypothetical protein
MKKDLILTLDEYLKARCVARLIEPPAKYARHVPITTNDNAALYPEKRACRCDRWGHPCIDCTGKSKVR